MKKLKLTLVLCVLLSTLFFSPTLRACDLSDLTVNSVVDLGNGQYGIDMTMCVGSGYENGFAGADQNTQHFAFVLSNASFSSYPVTLTSPTTAAVYSGSLIFADSILYYENSSEWWTCVQEGCGPIQSACVDVYVVTQGLPDSLYVLGLEGAGIALAGCQGAEMGFNPSAELCNLQHNAVITNEGCDGTGGSITLAASGGVAPYSYSWSSGGSGASLTGLPAGTYNVTIADAAGCQKVHALTVEATPAASVSAGNDVTVYAGYQPLACTNLAATPTSGTAPFSYLWSTGETTASIAVCPGVTTTYSVTITDANGCTATDQVNVYAEDISCGPDKVLICKNGNTRCVKTQQVPGQLAQGAVLGACKNKTAFDQQVAEDGLGAAPNPFRDVTQLTFSVATDNEVRVEVYDLSGQRVAVVFEGMARAGQSYSRDFRAGSLAGGIYMVRMSGENGLNETHKLVIMK